MSVVIVSNEREGEIFRAERRGAPFSLLCEFRKNNLASLLDEAALAAVIPALTLQLLFSRLL